MTVGMDTRKDWVELHARRVNELFEQWQEPLGIDGADYGRCLEREFMDHCDDPLWRALIEGIC